MATMWSRHAEGPGRCVLVAERSAPVRCAKGMTVVPHESFDSCPQLDALLVPGGQGTRVEVGNRALTDFVARQAMGAQAMLSVCTGSFILHAAGLLGGKRATTHWGSLARLRALGDVEVVEERFVRDGDLWTSAGVSAGIDLMLAFIAAVTSDDVAGKVQFAAEYYPSDTIYGGYSSDARAPAYVRQS